jgi:Flp pilus assembly protein TadB
MFKKVKAFFAWVIAIIILGITTIMFYLGKVLIVLSLCTMLHFKRIQRTNQTFPRILLI